MKRRFDVIKNVEKLAWAVVKSKNGRTKKKFFFETKEEAMAKLKDDFEFCKRHVMGMRGAKEENGRCEVPGWGVSGNSMYVLMTGPESYEFSNGCDGIETTKVVEKGPTEKDFKKMREEEELAAYAATFTCAEIKIIR